MQIKPKVGIFTNFTGSDSAFSLVNVVATQLQMLVDNNYNPVLFVCPSFTGEGIWSDNRIEIRRSSPGNADHLDICESIRKIMADIDIMLCHDIVFLMPQNKEWAQALRILTKDFPRVRWLHWQHSRGDHAPIEIVPNSEFCYPNEGDLPHVAAINSTTMDKVHYVPHPLDINYLGWPKLAIQIAEEFEFPFVDVSMIYPSRLDKQKQIEMAVRVFAGFKKAGKSVCLLVADAYATGERFKEYKKECIDLARSLNLTEKEFAFLGEIYEECIYSTPRNVVKALFEMSNIFVQVSNSETSSLVVMEAALAGNLIVLNANFPPIHHLYKKALSLDFPSVTNPDVKYYRITRTVDGEENKIEDNQLYFDDKSRELLIPMLQSQLNIQVKRQQFRDRWPSKVFKDYLEPLLLKDWRPEDKVPFCKGDPEITAIICSLDNLEMLKRQIPVLIEEVGQIIVVNNGSIDETKQWLEENPINSLWVINMEKNEGAGKGRNAGLALWDKHPTKYTLMLDGGIMPPYGGVKAMKEYLLRHPEATSISPEIASCYTTEEEKAVFRFDQATIEDKNTFHQMCLSGTAYGLYREDKWIYRFSEEGPFGEPGWGVDDNDMAYQWRRNGLIHVDFVSDQGMVLYRRASGSFKRLADESGIWPNQYGSVYEKRLVKLNQDYPEYQGMPVTISCVVLGWNEYPMIAKVVKTLHEELKDIYHEIIVVDNGSTDETGKWIKERRYRQHHGDTFIDTEGKIIRRSAENEEYWTGNFKVVQFDQNTGTGHGFNKGFEQAIGKYIFYICGDMLPVQNSIKGLYDYLESHPDIGYSGINAWMSTAKPEEVTEFNDYKTPLGLGNYAYSYAMIRREVWDAGVRFADQGPFEGPGAGFEEAEFANLMYSKGFKAHMFNDIMYLHARRDGVRSGLDTRTDGAGKDERIKYLMTKWNMIGFDIVHHHDQPPERHIRKIAMMNNLYENNPGPAGFLAMALRKIGCEVLQYNSLEDLPSEFKNETQWFDNYIFVDDGDLLHWTCPKWAHPSIYWAIDMYNPSCFPYASPEEYVKKGKTFDQFCSISKSAVEYCMVNGLDAFLLPHAANEDYHKPYDLEKVYDWIAIWSNYGDRENYSNAAKEKFPGGFVGSGFFGEDYPKMVSQAKCAISKARGYEYPARVVETMMIGTPLVTYRDKYLDLFFIENEHYRGFSSIEEMLEQIQWVQDHSDEAAMMASRARNLVLREHRYYHRALRLFGG